MPHTDRIFTKHNTFEAQKSYKKLDVLLAFNFIKPIHFHLK